MAVQDTGVIVLQESKAGNSGESRTVDVPDAGYLPVRCQSEQRTLKSPKPNRFSFRMDATNVLNHPNPLPIAPAISINSASGDFGLSDKTTNWDPSVSRPNCD
jgi:hypothetical protein